MPVGVFPVLLLLRALRGALFLLGSFYEIADDVVCEHVDLLSSTGIFGGGADAGVGEVFKFAIGPAGKGDDFCAVTLSKSSGFEDIRRSAAGGKGPEQVSFADQSLDLAGEDIFVSVIVTDTGQHRCIRR